jgi:hypothetical protein
VTSLVLEDAARQCHGVLLVAGKEMSMLPILAWRTRPKNSFEMLTVLVTLILPVAAQITD